jgi:hypothetical protein
MGSFCGKTFWHIGISCQNEDSQDRGSIVPKQTLLQHFVRNCQCLWEGSYPAARGVLIKSL